MGHSIIETEGDGNLNCLVSILHPTDSDGGNFLYIPELEAIILLLPRYLHDVA